MNLLATALFLVATAYLYGAFGTLNIADIATKASGMRGSAPLMSTDGENGPGSTPPSWASTGSVEEGDRVTPPG